ncbi:transcriptional regulator GlxA family with amidase domain [Nocardiopsis arvandica]|uniref:Transcriptional regulator GlxA family with amidase domain n=1 Tax=Nocardiopsis sinuspersici TaxID=501010 RepID=A0A7Z0BN98_9ACTN|nr:transcriptional regulator GlxA family with amidase domain [Nocardiopsis sinuspersici]
MRAAIVLFEGLTLLDAVGPYEMWAGLPGVEVVFVAAERGPVRDGGGRGALVADAAFGEVERADVVCVPGGVGQARHMDGGPLVEWVRAVDATSTWTTSVCTGSLVLAAAGLLEGRRATSHWLALEELGRWGALPVEERVVVDGGYVTAAGVSAGIDMGLTMVGRLLGERAAQVVQLAAEYDPRPPFSAGSPRTAPVEVVERVRGRSRFASRAAGGPS